MDGNELIIYNHIKDAKNEGRSLRLPRYLD